MSEKIKPCPNYIGYDRERANKRIAEAIGWTYVHSDEWGPLRGVMPGDIMKMGQVFTDVPDFITIIESHFMPLPEPPKEGGNI